MRLGNCPSQQHRASKVQTVPQDTWQAVLPKSLGIKGAAECEPPPFGGRGERAWSEVSVTGSAGPDCGPQDRGPQHWAWGDRDLIPSEASLLPLPVPPQGLGPRAGVEALWPTIC